MPDVSIVVKAEDRYSDSTKKMATATKSFSKDVDSLEKGLDLLSKNKATLHVDVQDAKDALKAAEKQFRATRSEADGLKLELAQANYDNIVRNMKLVTKAADDMGKSISKAENRAGLSGGSQMGNALKSIAASGGIKMIGDAASQWANTLITSAGGSDAGTLFSGLLSGASSGAGTDLRHTIISNLDDPDNPSNQRVAVKGVSFDDLTLADWEAAKLGTIEAPFTAESYEILDS